MTVTSGTYKYIILEFAVDTKGSGTNTSAPPLTKILVSIDQVEETLLSGLMETTLTGIFKTWVECLVNDIIFQFGRVFDSCPCKLLHHCVGHLFGKLFCCRFAF